MEGTGAALSLEQIVEINRLQIEMFGGDFFTHDNNLRDRGALEHVLEQLNAELFDQPLYPSAIDQAAHLCHRIAGGHIFHDGNKRTGMEVCRVYLELFDIHLRIAVGQPDEDLIATSILIATGALSEQGVKDWIYRRWDTD
jgi:death-on-curing protein